MMEILAFFKTLYSNRYVIISSSLVLLLFSFYIYHLRATNRIESLERDNKELNRIVAEQQKQIDVLKVNYDAIIKAKDELSTEVQALKEQQRQEEQKIYRENDNKKSLEELAVKKTGLVQKVINKATKKAFDCFVTISEGGDC
jgi:septal ring factor EnvC (AmiA/AmiB activator)